MATDNEFSSCSSSLVDSGFESSPPKPPPRQRRSKSTWSLAERDRDELELVKFSSGRKSSSKSFSGFFAPLKNFAPNAREKLKQSFWSLVMFGAEWHVTDVMIDELTFSIPLSLSDDNSNESTAIRGRMVSWRSASRRSCAATQNRRRFSGARNDAER